MSLQHRIEYAGFLAASGLLRSLPHRFAGPLGRASGRLFHRLSRYRRNLARENIRRALPELPEEEVRRIARASFENQGVMFLEAASANRFAGHELEDLFDFEGWEHFQRLADADRGFFILTGHIGGYEQGMYPVTHRLGPLHLVLKAQSNPLVSEKIRQMRAKRGHILIYPRRAGLPMMRAVRKGGRVGLLIDQRVQPKDGSLMPFLGRPAWSPTLLARLSIRSGCPVVPSYGFPLPDGRFRAVIEPPIEPEGQGIEAELALTQRYIASLEARIRTHPELWYWMHTRWRLTVQHRWPKVLERLAREAGVPPGEGIEGFDAQRLPERSRHELERLRRGEFLEECENLLVSGPPGSGRSRTAAALVDSLAATGHPARFADASTLLGQLIGRRADGELAAEWQKLDKIELLALDDIDRLATSEHREMLLTLLRQRHLRRCTLVTTRVPLSEWTSIFADPEQAAEARSLLVTPGSHLELG